MTRPVYRRWQIGFFFGGGESEGGAAYWHTAAASAMRKPHAACTYAYAEHLCARRRVALRAYDAHFCDGWAMLDNAHETQFHGLLG